jgi:hypothetical protein
VIDDKKIQLSNGIIGNFTHNPREENNSTVLMIHGFASNKNEVGDMYKIMAHELASTGISSLRIDFRGWGESAGIESDITLHGMLSDASIALDYLIYSNLTKKSKIGVVGFSIGASIAAKLIKSMYYSIKSVVLLSSVGNVFEDQSLSLKENFTKNISSIHENDLFDYDLPHAKGNLKSSYIRSLKQFNVYEDIKSINIPTLLIAGSNDRSAERSRIIFENSPSENKNILIIPDSDHIFHALDQNSSDSKTVISEIVSFFQTNLVSL